MNTRSVITALACASLLPSAATAAAADHDPWECAPAKGKAPGWCQTFSTDTVELLAADGTAIERAECATRRAPAPDEPRAGLCASWGDWPAFLDIARGAGAVTVRRHMVRPLDGDRQLLVTVPAPGALDTPIRMTGRGGTVSPAYDVRTTMTVAGREPGVTAAPIPLYTKKQRTARARRAAARSDFRR